MEDNHMFGKILAICIALFLVLPSASFADLQSEAELWNIICTNEQIPLSEMIEMLDAKSFQTTQLTELSRICEGLSAREGLFIQDGRSSKGKAYTATVEFYFNKGVPYCSVNYTNYGGTLSDAPVEYTEEAGFFSHPEGQFYSSIHAFSITFEEDSLHIHWADTNDYTLTRSSGNVSEYTDEVIPFEERELYQTIVDLFDNMLGNVKHQCAYGEEEKTFYVYVTMGESLRTVLLTNGDYYEETWNNILDGFVDITERVAAAVSLEIREGIGDITKAHCTVMFVDSLNNQKEYNSQEALAIITDGKITYDLLKDGIQKKQAQSSTASGYAPTIGEKNALRSAKNYLKIAAFSKSGLIDQLKYEGYSQSEAEYAAAYCGANWYEQAAKSAEAYLELMAFSRNGLIDQLEYEGFTYEQAVYGVTQNGY